jgi:hypothetical protein
MMDLLFVGIGWTDLAITLNRIASGRSLCCRDISIMGGFLLLYISGAGKYSIDAFWGIATP